MFNGGTSSSHSAPSRRIATLIGLGGVSVAAVATTIWMYQKRNQKAQRGNADDKDVDQQQQQQDKGTTTVKTIDNDDDTVTTTKTNDDVSGGGPSSVDITTTTDTVTATTEDTLNEETNDVSGPSTDDVGNCAVEQLQQQQEEETNNEDNCSVGKKLKTEPNEEEEATEQQQQQPPATEKTTTTTEETTDQMLLQQHHNHHHRDGVSAHEGGGTRQTYAGRASIGSTGTAGGDGRTPHPVNSICTCSRCLETLNDLQSSRGYKNAESPNSTQSEGSADSGRATGPLTSYSPFADVAAELGGHDILPIYEFEVPNTLVGLIIGVKGKTIKELCTRADVRMLIRPHHTQGKYESHQICSVEGRRENINKCLHMIRLRFPPCRFPDLNLKPVLPPPATTAAAPATATTTATTASSDSNTVRDAPSVLTLPVGVPCEIYISAHVDAGHFFVQLPTHPSFASLTVLDQYMLSVYTQPGGAPDLPKPCNVGVLCAAPAYNGWFRAITLAYDQDQDEMLVRFVDYGGFAHLPRADLRQIRTDFMSLPLQGIECYLANVQPADGSSHWSEKANELFQQLCVSKIIQATLVGYCKNTGIPCVELFVLDNNKKTVRVDQILSERGLAKPMEPTLMVRTPLLMA